MLVEYTRTNVVFPVTLINSKTASTRAGSKELPSSAHTNAALMSICYFISTRLLSISLSDLADEKH